MVHEQKFKDLLSGTCQVSDKETLAFCINYLFLKISKTEKSVTWYEFKALVNGNLHWNWFSYQLFPMYFHYGKTQILQDFQLPKTLSIKIPSQVGKYLANRTERSNESSYTLFNVFTWNLFNVFTWNSSLSSTQSLSSSVDGTLIVEGFQEMSSSVEYNSSDSIDSFWQDVFCQKFLIGQ